MSLIFIGSNPRLEADYADTSSEMCAVITHPHSLMGGSMSNNVVMAARDTVISMGYSALRFNFRGVGRSSGSFDKGVGEVADLTAAVQHVNQPVFVIGYSFGAWVAARFLRETNIPAIFISPPTGMFDFPSLKGLNVWSVAGTYDQFCNTDALLAVMEKDRITLIDGVDHFWFGDEQQLKLFLKGKIELIARQLINPAP